MSSFLKALALALVLSLALAVALGLLLALSGSGSSALHLPCVFAAFALRFFVGGGGEGGAAVYCAIEYCRVLLSTTMYYRVLQCTTEYYKALQCTTGREADKQSKQAGRGKQGEGKDQTRHSRRKQQLANKICLQVGSQSLVFTLCCILLRFLPAFCCVFRSPQSKNQNSVS